MDVSVVVPVYNTEKYLRAFMESVLSQTCKSFEVILVDDGSKDKSGEICDEYAEADGRIRVIHKKNEGTGFARNDGMKAALGEYIYFCDPDDILYPTLIEDNAALGKSCGADMVVFGSERLIEREGRLIPECVSVPELEGIYDYEGFWDNFEKENEIVDSLWNRLFRREFLIQNGIKSVSLSSGQDAYFLYDVYAAPLGRVVYNRRIYYKYIIRSGSATTGFKPERLDNVYKCTKHYEEVLKNSPGARGRYGYIAEDEYVVSTSCGIRAMCGSADLNIFRVSRIIKEHMKRAEIKAAFEKYDFKKVKGIKAKIRLFLIKHRFIFMFIAATRLYRVIRNIN